MKLIGLSGAARSGKDTVGEYLITKHNFKRYAFADPLKRAASEMFGIPLEDFHSDSKKEVVNKFWGFSPRQIAQLIGTEGGRELFRDDIWVRRAHLEYITHLETTAMLPKERYDNGTVDGLNGMVITDVRFPNEAEWIKEFDGVVIHIERPGADGVVGEASHASEAGYPDEFKDFIVQNDGSLDDLYVKIDEIFEKVTA